MLYITSIYYLVYNTVILHKGHEYQINMYRDERVVDVLRGLRRTGIIIAFIDPTDGSWSDDLMVSDNKWRPMIDAILYS